MRTIYLYLSYLVFKSLGLFLLKKIDTILVLTSYLDFGVLSSASKNSSRESVSSEFEALSDMT